MANLYGTPGDGYLVSAIDATWANARDDTTANTYSSVAASYTGFTSVSRFGSRGGGNTYKVIRSFLRFDTSGITGTVSAATIKIFGTTANDGSIIPVKSTAYGGDGGSGLAVADLDAITGYSAGSSLAGNATTYGPQILTSSWSTSGYNDFTGTSDLRADMQNNDAVIICFMDYTNDYLNSAPSSNATLNCGGYYANNTGTSKDPYIEYTVAGPTVASVSGLAAASVRFVSGFTAASIAKINDLDWD